MPQGSGGGHGVVAGRTHISAGELVAFATRHPVQRRESNLQSEGRLTFDMVARGTHERLRIHWGASRERKGQVVLLERLGGGEPLSLFAWSRRNQVAENSTRLDAGVSFGDGAKGGDVRVGRRGLDAVPRIGLIDATGVQQQLLGHGRQRHIRRMPAAQALHQVDGAVHIATRGQGPRSPLLVMPVRLGVERQHTQQFVEPSGVEQRAVAERARLGVGVGALPAVGHDVLHQGQQLVSPVRSE